MPNSPQFSASKAALAIFCRAPRLGTVKTRLAQTHGDEFALNLYRAMLADTFDLGRAFAPEVESVACFTPRDGLEGENSLAEFWDGLKLAQCEGDLGTKIFDCFAQLRLRGYGKVAVIGSDAPDLPLHYIQQAFEDLKQNQLTVGASFDGGFYLLGAAIHFPAALFEGISWSSNTVFQRLMHNIGTQFSVAQLATWQDVDDEVDLIALRRRLFEIGKHAPHTRQFLEENLAQRR